MFSLPVITPPKLKTGYIIAKLRNPGPGMNVFVMMR